MSGIPTWAHLLILLGQAPAEPAGDDPAGSGEILVTGSRGAGRADQLSSQALLEGETLARSIAPTLGDTLTALPGVSATSFGPNASRPILRGFQGDRSRVLTDGIGAFDVSNTSADHAVVINPLIATRVEVLRGPAALSYGTSPIAGVVNVGDGRIAAARPDGGASVDALATLGSAARERSIGAAANVAAGRNLVVHFDASFAETGDLRTGGRLLTGDLRRQASESGDPAIRALSGLGPRLPNSASRRWDAAGGASIVTDRGHLGFAISRYENVYGVPVRYSLDPDTPGEAVSLDMRQTRLDLRSQIDDAGPFETIGFRGGYADYSHVEREADGGVGTLFANKGMEARVDLRQRRRGGWSGRSGAQVVTRDFRIEGAEKFLPPTMTEQVGLFTAQEYAAGPLTAEIGARIERSAIRAAADADIGNPALDRSFTTLSAAAGANLEVAPGWRIGVTGSRSERAPSAEELFADGPHVGTQAFEVGDPTFRKEKSWGVEGVVRHGGPGFAIEATAHHSWFDDYIYEELTGAAVDGLPVYQFRQAAARYWGFELSANAALADIGGWKLSAYALADYVRAEVVREGPAPRIPPLRIRGGLTAGRDATTATATVEHVFRQARVTAFETPTDGYTLVSLSGSWAPTRLPFSFTLSANNLFDAVARRHASFLKDVAPLAGRDMRLTARLAI